MSENIRSTNLRFNLEKDTQKRAWQYLQNMDKQQFKSYSNVIAVALVEYFAIIAVRMILTLKPGNVRNDL